MLKKITPLFLFLLILNSHYLFADKVGLLIAATGKYVSFVNPLITSAEKHFCKDHDVTYFVFTDGDIQESDKIVRIFHPHLGWPFATMMRFHAYAKSQDLLSTQDYLFACDADMLFVDEVGNEILGERVATLHPGFMGRGSYEVNPLSTACVNKWEGKNYFAGGFYGGTAQEVLTIAETLSKRIDEDLSKGIIAIWHDESHWNRYCIDYPPTVILSPSYCYPESWVPGNWAPSHWDFSLRKRLIALDKNHKQIRE